MGERTLILRPIDFGSAVAAPAASGAEHDAVPLRSRFGPRTVALPFRCRPCAGTTHRRAGDGRML
ncbi:hypothetical protein BMUNKI379_18985 [Burkholderia multivorans]|nr:hypothetical protein BMUNKI379_18985 [Burkholderia multivorans]